MIRKAPGRAAVDQVARAVAGLGLIARGGFRPEAADGVPGLPDGRPAGTLVMVGNAGPAMWRAFAATRPDLDAAHPLDTWLEPQLKTAAASLGAHPVFPKDGPPYPPFPRWAARAEDVHVSPLGLLIHPDYGLWHAYRAAFVFVERHELPPRPERPSPCDACAAKPCLTACPVEAFTASGFDSASCAGHIGAAEGADCLGRGCLARRACPIGRGYVYAPAQANFHMAKFLAAMRRYRATSNQAI